MDFQKLVDKLYLYSIDHFVHWRRHIKEYFWAIVIALILRALVLTIYKIPTGSMIPTFREGDMLIANRFYYGLKIPFTDGLPGWKLPAIREPAVGDVVIFRSSGEEDFHSLTIQPQNASAKALLFEINEKTTFRHAIWKEKFFTNFIFTYDPLSVTPLFGERFGAYSLILIKDLYDRYEKQLTDRTLFRTFSHQIDRRPITFAEQKYPGIFRSIMNTPIAGISMILTASLDSPLGFVGKAVLMLPNALQGKSFSLDRYIRKISSFSLYPNPFVDMTKEYVKRMIANEGDTVEIINKQVFVNGRPHIPDSYSFVEEIPWRSSGQITAFRITTNTIPSDTKIGQGKTKSRQYPLRVLEGVAPLLPSRPFDPQVWPYFPHLNNQYSDNFGPIVVPKNHIFVLGDNRDDSFDARYWGCVPKWSIIGTPMIKIFPLNRFGLIQ